MSLLGKLNLSKLEKLKISAHPTPKRKKVDGVFEAMFNPETYSLSYKNVYDQKQGINTSGRTAKYAMSKPTVLSLTLVLDGTGVDVYGLSILGKPTDVYKRVQEFLELTSHMDGDIHEPKHLTVSWGDLTFKCRLDSVDVRYSLFDSSGVPLRAELTTVFFGDIEQSERIKNEGKSSPDLTHSRIVGAEDLLPVMCEKIYGSPHYYIQVAKANNLRDFRNLKPGQEIFFPPIEK